MKRAGYSISLLLPIERFVNNSAGYLLGYTEVYIFLETYGILFT